MKTEKSNKEVKVIVHQCEICDTCKNNERALATKDLKKLMEDHLFDVDVTGSTEWREFWEKDIGEPEKT